MSFDPKLLRQIIEGALLAAGQPLTVDKLQTLFDDLDTEQPAAPSRDEIKAALEALQAECEGRGFELQEVGSGWRYQVRKEMAQWVNRLWEEKPQKYSRALLETLALIAYRQPITRGDIEEIRGVAVSSHIIKTLTEREWVKVVGHRDVPGRPSLYATTRQFLDYFNLKSLEQLPSLNELQDIDQLNAELDLGATEAQAKPEQEHQAEQEPQAEQELQPEQEPQSEQEPPSDQTDNSEAPTSTGSEMVEAVPNQETDQELDSELETELEPEPAQEDAETDLNPSFAEQGMTEEELQQPAAPIPVEQDDDDQDDEDRFAVPKGPSVFD